MFQTIKKYVLGHFLSKVYCGSEYFDVNFECLWKDTKSVVIQKFMSKYCSLRFIFYNALKGMVSVWERLK